MAKKKGVLDSLMGALESSGSDILGDVLENLTDSKEQRDGLGGVLGDLLGDAGAARVLETLGRAVEALTGSVSSSASDAAKQKGKEKVSMSEKKATKPSTAKPASARHSSVKEKAEAAKERVRAKTGQASVSKKKETP